MKLTNLISILLFFLGASISHAQTPPKYRVTVLRAPQPWTMVKVDGITDSGVIYGAVTNGGGENTIAGHGFIWRGGTMRIVPDPPMSNIRIFGGGQYYETIAASSSGQPLIEKRTVSWDGAWMGDATAVWIDQNGKWSLLPGLTKFQNVAKVFRDKSGNLFGECNSENTIAHPDSENTHIVQWIAGQAKDLGDGEAFGIGVDGYFYAQTPSGEEKFIGTGNDADGIATLSKEAAAFIPGNYAVSMCPNGWFVYQADDGYAVLFANSKKLVSFEPSDALNIHKIVGQKRSRNDGVPDTAVISIYGRVFDLTQCIVNIPKGWRLDEADFISRTGEIIAVALPPADEQNVPGNVVLLTPVR